MIFHAEARIELKAGVIDAEGETVQKSLKLLGYPTTKVNTIKVYSIEIEAGSREEAEKKIDDACKRLLANPVVQNYSVSVKNV
jgi:phosphoribosylformylglycinamidine synthase PurS subunit